MLSFVEEKNKYYEKTHKNPGDKEVAVPLASGIFFFACFTCFSVQLRLRGGSGRRLLFAVGGVSFLVQQVDDVENRVKERFDDLKNFVHGHGGTSSFCYY